MGAGNCQACAACANMGPCNALQQACVSNPECGALFNCLQMCFGPGAGCPGKCASDHAAGVADLKAVENCDGCTCPNHCPTLGCM
jgi:hypothetical protein